MNWLKGKIRTGPYARMEWGEKFWLFVGRGSGDACWEWQGKRFPNGYGCFLVSTVGKLAHRVSYEIHTGHPPGDLKVCHQCDNPSCVNPNHLFLGTTMENIHDAIQKGRKAVLRGEKSSVSKLTKEQVIEIRRLYNVDGLPAPEISARFNISTQSISGIAYFKSWRHVGGPRPTAEVIAKGGRTPKLNAALVREARRKAAQGETHERIAQQYGVTRETITSAVNRKNWKHVE